MRHLVTALTVLAICGCANPFATHYQGTADARLLPAYDAAAENVTIQRSDNLTRDRLALMRRGYAQIGEASFNADASRIGEAQLREHAIKIGAHAVLLASRHTHTETGAVPLTVPQTTTTYSTGTATAYGSGVSVRASGSGSTTTYGSQTLLVPFTINKADFMALFFAKTHPRAGLFIQPTDEATRKRLKTNSGMQVVEVVTGSPAYRAEVIPGDVVLTIGGEPLESLEQYSDLLRKFGGQTVIFRIDRDSSITEKHIEIKPLPPVAKKPVTEPPPRVDSGRNANSEAHQWSDTSLQSAQNGNWADAIRRASVAISMDPALAAAYINRCWAYLARGDLDEALSDCEMALKLEPNSGPALNNRGAIWAQKGDTSAALRDYSQACQAGFDKGCENFKSIKGYSLKDANNIAKTAVSEASVKFAQKNWEGAVAEASKAIEAAPGTAEAYITRSGAYANLGRLSEALADAQAAIKLDPDQGLAYNNRGYVFELQKKPRQAALDYEIACGLKSELGCQNFKRLRP